ncbi:hypothetical protein TWF730_000877 [Orbilia blumenaviensis]|uniref:Uncharacterized protein n=1 Tax=Orbilia blumenaviensis TaxID=1796055 RepID=A0AAV9VR04_9PEZI
MIKMTRRVHRVPLGPFLVLFLNPLLSHAQSIATSSIPSPSSTISTSTTVSSTKSSAAVSSTTTTKATETAAAAAAEEPKNMLITVSYVGIAVGCAVLLIFALTIFFSYRQKNSRSEQPPMTDAKKEYIESFKNQQNGSGGNGQGAGMNGAANNGSWINSTANPDAKDNTHTRSGSKSSLARFHFRSASKSQEPAMEPTLKIEVTSNPSLRPVSVIPDALVPKRLKPQQQKADQFQGYSSQAPPMPKFEVPGKIIYEDTRISEPPHAMTTSDNEGSYKFPPRTTSRRAPPMPLAIRPFAPSAAGTPRTIAMQSPQSFTAVGLSPAPPRRNEMQPQSSKSPYNQSQLSPIQMQPIRPYSPLESASAKNSDPQPYVPSWMNMPNQYPKMERAEPRSITPQYSTKHIPRELRPMSSTTIASDASRASRRFSDDGYSSYDSEEYSDDEDRNYDYRSQVYDSYYRRSTDSYDDDRRPLSAQSYESGWSYGPSHTSKEKAHVAPRTHAEPYASSQVYARDRSGAHSRQKTPVPVNANSTLSPTSYTNSRGGREAAVKVSPVTPPPAPPPKDWEVVAIKMDPYPPFEAAIRPAPSRGNTPRPILKAGGLPNNPKTGKRTGWEMDLERGY